MSPLIPCLNPACELPRDHDGRCLPVERQFDETAEAITDWISAGLQEEYDLLSSEGVAELVEEVRIRHQNRLDPCKRKLDQIRALCDKPDFKVGRLVKVDSLLEVLDG